MTVNPNNETVSLETTIDGKAGEGILPTVPVLNNGTCREGVGVVGSDITNLIRVSVSEKGLS